jgi:hypothetical protein
MDDMTYQGINYRTSNMGVYRSPNRSALTSLGHHKFSDTRRQQGITYHDRYILEAFEAYPFGFDQDKFIGWSRSHYTTEAHINSVLKMQSHYRFLKPRDSSMVETDSYCTRYFKDLPKVVSLDFNSELTKVPFEPSSSAGIGIPGKKGDDGNLLRAIRQANATINNCLRSGIQTVIEQSTPDMAFTRTQLTEIAVKLKVRNVFGEAFQYILIEGCTASPLMTFFITHDTFFFVGTDPKTGVPTLLEDLKRRSSKLISIDWSSFDTSVEDWEINDAFDLLESMLIFPNLQSRAAFEFSRIFFINRKIAAPDSQVYMKHHSVPSGSYFTMLIDSIVNWRRILYLHHRAFGTFPIGIRTQGDDSLFGTHKDSTPEAMALQIPSDSKWVFNPYKSPSGPSGATVPFLQRVLKWGDQARNVDTAERLALYPEYDHDDPRISAYRARAIWEDCNYESNLLAFATEYLETKYGIPEHIPKRFRKFARYSYEFDRKSDNM